MTTLTPTQMRRIARDLMNDAVNGREDGASRNDGEVLARFVETGTATRAGLDAAAQKRRFATHSPDHALSCIRSPRPARRHRRASPRGSRWRGPAPRELALQRRIA